MGELRWQYETVSDLDQSLAQRLRNFPREPEMFVYALRSLSALTLRGWLRTYHRFAIDGRENLPLDESFIMVCNHASHLDALCLLSALPLKKLHRAFPIAARDYFFVNIRRVAIAAIFVNAMPFARKEGIRESMELCRQVLDNPGNIIILFPEGTRTKTREMGEFRPGIGSLVAGRSVKVVPCAVRGTFDALRKGAWFPRPRKLTLTIGKPRSFADYSTERDSVHRISSELQHAVTELLCS